MMVHIRKYPNSEYQRIKIDVDGKFFFDGIWPHFNVAMLESLLKRDLKRQLDGSWEILDHKNEVLEFWPGLLIFDTQLWTGEDRGTPKRVI
jgi:hypothetical protein